MNRLERAYRASDYEAAGAVARVGRRCPAVDALLARLGVRQGGFLGAWNPLSRRMPPGWNRRAEARLRAAAAGLPFAEGWGGTPHWREHHLLIAGDPRRLARLGRRFRQRAMLVLVQGRPPRLVWLRGGGSDGR